jgi:TonB family protein
VPTLSRRLRWFVAALVLVVAQGLTAREALAQVRRAMPHRPATTQKKHSSIPKAREERVVTDGIVMEEPPLAPSDTSTLRTSAEVMPTLQGRDYQGMVAYIQQQVHWPEDSGRVDAEGRVFVRFTVGTDGLVHGAEVLKGIHPLLNAEALRVVQALTGFTPGRQNGRPVPVSLTVPVTFQRK